MKIYNVPGVVGNYNQLKTRKVAKGGDLSRTEKGDEVRLSREVQEVRALKDKVAQVSDVRTERVEELRRQISAGTYKVSGREVADRMLTSRVFDDLV